MTATKTAFDPAKTEAFGGRMMSILGGSLLSSMVDIGHRTGLFAAAAGGWATSQQLAATAPELAGVRSFLDVGTGIGLLAIAAARVWPQAAIVGIDIRGPSLEAAAANVRAAGLAGQITIRNQDVTALDDAGAYDCAWFPTFFVTGAVFEAAMPRLFQALRPGGWLLLGRMAPPPDPLAQAVSMLRTIRNGGAEFDTKCLITTLETGGCTAVRVLPRQGPMPLEYVIGQRPTA